MLFLVLYEIFPLLLEFLSYFGLKIAHLFLETLPLLPEI